MSGTVPREASGPRHHRVVIVGGGFGGLYAARFLRRAPVDITLVDRTNHHLFQPLLYQVAAGILSEGDIAPPLRGLFRRQKHVRVELAEVTDFDLDGRTVLARRPDGEPRTLPYDSLIVAAGAGSSYFGHDEFAPYALSMKTIDDALNLRRRVFGAFELAEIEPDPEQCRSWLTFVIVGGGPTGVEMAGQIAELSRRTLRRNFRSIDPASASILIVDGGKEVLASFGDRLSAKAAKALEKNGIEIRSQTRVTGVDSEGVVVQGPDGHGRIAARTVVWAAGVEASPLAQRLAEACGAECDRAGRIAVEADCTLRGHPQVFAIGDMMSLDRLPGVVEVAMQQGIYVGRTIGRRLRGKAPLQPFRYRDLGSLAVIGRGHAVVSFRGVRFGGRLGFVVWLLVHIAFLTGFFNRVRAFFHWSYSLATGARAERTMTVHSVSDNWYLRAGGSSEPAQPPTD